MDIGGGMSGREREGKGSVRTVAITTSAVMVETAESENGKQDIKEEIMASTADVVDGE